MTMSGPLLWLVIASWALLIACFAAAGGYFIVRPRVIRAFKGMRRALRRDAEFKAHGFAHARTGGSNYSAPKGGGGNVHEESAGANVFSDRTYVAFISYAHADQAFANHMRKRLEAFKLHKRVEGNAGALGPGGLGQIFRMKLNSVPRQTWDKRFAMRSTLPKISSSSVRRHRPSRTGSMKRFCIFEEHE